MTWDSFINMDDVLFFSELIFTLALGDAEKHQHNVAPTTYLTIPVLSQF